MIETIAHKGLRLLWEKNDPSKLPSEQIEKIRRILSALNTAKTLGPLRMIPGYKLHSLTGELKDFGRYGLQEITGSILDLKMVMLSILIMQTIIKTKSMENNMPPVHPGGVLREDILKEMKLSITKAAENLKVSRKQLSEVVNEVAAISPEMAVRLEDAFGISSEFWLDMQKAHDIWKVKHSGKVTGVRRIQSEPFSHAS